jgi:hypothetical protein
MMPCAMRFTTAPSPSRSEKRMILGRVNRRVLTPCATAGSEKAEATEHLFGASAVDRLCASCASVIDRGSPCTL